MAILSGGFALTCVAFSAAAQSPASSSDALALVGGTIYRSPTEEPIRDGVVLIRDGRIAAVGTRTTIQVPRGITSIDCSGLTVTAGFWNSHVHFFERKWASAAAIPSAELTTQLEDMLTRYGFTTVIDLGSMWENTRIIRDRIESGDVRGPAVRSTGEALIPKGAMPSNAVLGVLGLMTYPVPEIRGATDAAAAARQLLERGVDGIKLFVQGPSALLPDSVIGAVVSEAHRAGKPVFAHAATRASLIAAVRSGVDVITHSTPVAGPWDDVFALMKQYGVAIIPTLNVWRYNARHDRVTRQRQVVDDAVGQLRAWIDAGGEVLFGTDVGYTDYDPLEEYVLLSRAGMTVRQILASLTTVPARRFAEGATSGRIAPGFQADLVVLAGAELTEARSFANVRYTIRQGRISYRR